MSITPFLIVAQLAFIAVIVQRARRSGAVSAQAVTALVSLVWIGLGGWSLATSFIGATGGYESESFYTAWGGLWLPAVPILLLLGPVFSVARLRRALEAVLAATPVHWLTAVQALRISAIGTAYKTHLGLFPTYFEFAVGVPDLLFGISALAMTRLARRGRVSARALVIWNVIGIAIVVPTAPILIQLGLPGPLQVFDTAPTATAVYAFPMSLAPTMVVPTFVLLNVVAVWRQLRIPADKAAELKLAS